jgi:hypothetical protein
VNVLSGPFKAHDGVPADCRHGPACAGYRITAANIGDVRCYAYLEYTGDPVYPAANPDGLDVDGSLELLGSLSCHGASRAACDRELDSLHLSGVSEIGFTRPSCRRATDTGSSPPGTQDRRRSTGRDRRLGSP